MADKQLSLHERAMYNRLSDEEWEAMAAELRQLPPGRKLYDYLALFGYADRVKYKPLLTSFLEGDDDEAQFIMARKLFALLNSIDLYMDSAIKLIRQKPKWGIDDVIRNSSRAVSASAAKEYLAKQWHSELVAALVSVALSQFAMDARPKPSSFEPRPASVSARVVYFKFLLYSIGGGNGAPRRACDRKGTADLGYGTGSAACDRLADGRVASQFV